LLKIACCMSRWLGTSAPPYFKNSPSKNAGFEEANWGNASYRFPYQNKAVGFDQRPATTAVRLLYTTATPERALACVRGSGRYIKPL
jgi:hypothetical protein